jgi:hypothetical protein
VSDIHTVSRSSGHVESTPLHVFDNRFSNLKPLHSIWAKTTILRFSARQFVLFALACLTIATVGCGSGGVDPAASSVVLSPGSVDFGDVPVGQAASSSVNIVNNSTVSAVVSQVSVAGQTFSVTGQGNLPINIPAGGSHTLNVGFTPASTTDYSGQLTVMDASAKPMAQIAIHGRGANHTNPQLTVSTSSLSFGSETVNTATTQPLTLTSTGTSPVTVNSAAISGAGFTIISGSFPMTLTPTQAVTLQVQFDPTAAGAATGLISVSSNSSSSTTAVVALSGTGTAASSPQATSQLKLSAISLNFGSVTLNTATTQTLTLTSVGTSPVTVNSAAISGTGFTIVGGSFPMTLNPTQSVTLNVQFDPTTTGAATGQISVNNNSTNGSTSVVALSGTGTAVASPQLSLSTTSLSFGSVTVNNPTAQAITLTSTGTSPVTVNSAAISGTGFTIAGGSFPMTLSPTQSATLQVRFDPTATGAATGQISVSSNSSSGSTAVVALSGTGTAAANPQLTLSAAGLSFGSVTVNTSTTQTLTLTSTGTSPVTVNSAAISGTGFTIVSGSFPMTLSPTQSATLQVRFDPTATGAATGQMSVSSNSSSGSTSAVALSGTGTAAVNPQLTLSAASLSFGSVTVNTPTTQTLVLTSTGTSPVTVNSAAISGTGFTISGGSFPMTLSPTQAATLQVQFDPTATGATTGQVSISSNASSGSTAVVALNGTGTAAANPQLTLSATSLSFGSVTVNSTTTQPLTLTSTGTSPVTVNSAAISGTGFTIVGGTFPMTLTPTQAVTLHVQFDPTATGAATGQISVSSNSTNGSTAAVALSGTGTAAANPQLTLSAASLSFGSVTVNTPTTQTLTLTSTGTSPVTVNSAAISGAGFTIISGTLPTTLSPTQAATLQVQFDPTATGSAAGQISISSNSSSGGTAVIALSGTGAAAPNPQLTLSATSLSFGSVTVNTKTTQTLVLTSTGTSPVTVNSAAISGTGFTISGGSFPMTLSPTQAATLQVQFDPTATGAATGQISISSNSTSGGTAVVALSGTGAAAPNPQLNLSATSLSFGSVTVNNQTTQTLVLTSTGTSPVTVNSAAISGAGFTIAGGSFPITLSPTQAVTLTVQFDPTATGAATGQISVSSNSTSGGTAVVALSGTGTAADPQLTVSATSLSFGSVAVNTPTTLTLTLKSTGTTPVTVSSIAISGAGFTTVGGSFPITINPTQAITLNVQFDPTAGGAATGQLTINSNSTSGASVVVALSGTGTAVAHEVDLTWTAPTSSPDPVTGYNIYRATGSGPFVLINSSPDKSTTDIDNTVVSATSYNYVVKSVDSGGVESIASNQIQVTIP